MKKKLGLGNLLLLVVLVLAFLTSGMNAFAAGEDEVEAVSVTLHKRLFETMPELKENTGEEMDFGGEPLAGVEFTIYDVTEQYYELVDQGRFSTQEALEVLQEEALKNGAPANAEPKGFKKTNTDGDVTFSELKLRDAKNRDIVYLFLETDTSGAVTDPGYEITEMAIPMVLLMPVYTKDGKLIENIHLYPKNVAAQHEKIVENKKEYNEIRINDILYYNVANGDILKYSINIKVPSDIKNKEKFEVIDHPTKGLEFVNLDDLTITVDGGNQILSSDSDYALDKNNPAGGFTIHFNKTDKVVAAAGKTIQIKYNMRVNTEIPDEGLSNEATIYFDKESRVTSEEVITGGHQFKKIDSRSHLGLSGAGFIVFDEANQRYAIFSDDQNEDGNYVLEGWTDDPRKTKAIKSRTDGEFAIIGLKNGSYELIEKEIPAGYLPIKDSLKFEVTAGKFKSKESITTVENIPVSILPATGSNGIYAFLILGGLLMGSTYIWYRKSKHV